MAATLVLMDPAAHRTLVREHGWTRPKCSRTTAPLGSVGRGNDTTSPHVSTAISERMATIGGQMMLGRTLADKGNHIDWWQRCCT